MNKYKRGRAKMMRSERKRMNAYRAIWDAYSSYLSEFFANQVDIVNACNNLFPKKKENGGEMWIKTIE